MGLYVGGEPLEPSAVRADGTVHRLVDQSAGQRLAHYLLDSQRVLPVVVVSVDQGQSTPYIDADTVARELEGVAAVFVASAQATFGITDGFSDKTLSVFFGAGRVYPLGTAWRQHPRDAPLIFCTTPAKAKAATESLIDEGMQIAFESGSLKAPALRPEDQPTTVSVVKPLTQSQVLVVTQKGDQAVMLAHQLFPRIKVDRLVAPNQQLWGRLRSAGVLGEFVPDPVPDDPAARIRQAYPDGTVALALTGEVAADTATMLLHPRVPVELGAPAGGNLSRLVTPGDVVAVEVAWLDGECIAVLADEADLVPGVSVLPGGPSWLHPDDMKVTAPQPQGQAEERREPLPEEVRGVPAVLAVVPVDELHARLAQAEAAALQYGAEVTRLEGQVRSQEYEIAELKAELRSAYLIGAGEVPRVHSDPETQLRFEIELSYLYRTKEADRQTYPLRTDYLFGVDFIDSMEKTQGIKRSKVVAALSDVVCGRAKDISALQVREWKESKSGKQEVRQDWAKAYRVSLQVKSAGARRLKYWKLKDGRIELDSIGHHDEGIK